MNSWRPRVVSAFSCRSQPPRARPPISATAIAAGHALSRRTTISLLSTAGSYLHGWRRIDAPPRTQRACAEAQHRHFHAPPIWIRLSGSALGVGPRSSASIAAMGRKASRMEVRDGMSSVVLTLGPGHTLREAAARMTERKVGAAVVICDDEPAPRVVSER